MTIQISEFANKHLPTVIRLLNEEYRDSYEFIPLDEERLRSQIQRRHLRIHVAEENGNVSGLVGTYAEERGEENIFWLAACRGQNQKIIENILADEIEKNAKGDTISTMLDEGNPRIEEWIDRGYVLDAGFLRMVARLGCLKVIPRVSEGIKLRSLRPEEEEKLVEVVNTGFGWQRIEHGILETWKSENPPFSEDWVQVAEADERIVSAVVAKPDTDYVKYMHLNRGYLGPAATLPEFRNKHLASALTAQAMNFLLEKGMDSVRLGTSEKNISSITLLRNLGFQVGIARKLLRKRLKNA